MTNLQQNEEQAQGLSLAKKETIWQNAVEFMQSKGITASKLANQIEGISGATLSNMLNTKMGKHFGQHVAKAEQPYSQPPANRSF